MPLFSNIRSYFSKKQAEIEAFAKDLYGAKAKKADVVQISYTLSDESYQAITKDKSGASWKNYINDLKYYYRRELTAIIHQGQNTDLKGKKRYIHVPVANVEDLKSIAKAHNITHNRFISYLLDNRAKLLSKKK